MTGTRQENCASARKMFGKYKAVIVHATGRTEIIGTRYHLTQDGRDMRITQGAPLYDTREEALKVAQALIDARVKRAAERKSEYEARRRVWQSCPGIVNGGMCDE